MMQFDNWQFDNFVISCLLSKIHTRVQFVDNYGVFGHISEQRPDLHRVKYLKSV